MVNQCEDDDSLLSVVCLMRRLQQSIKPLQDEFQAFKKLQQSFQPLINLKKTFPFSNYCSSNQPYKREVYTHVGRVLVGEDLTPQLIKPIASQRPSTLDKMLERKEIYDQVVKESGKGVRRVVLLERAAERAGCSVDSIKRALGNKR